MVRITDSRVVTSEELMYVEYAGESTDEKPTVFGTVMNIVNGERVEKTVAIATGSVFIEVDTSNVYLFSEKEASWVKVGD